MTVSRRAFVAGAAAIPFALWLERNGFAQTPRVRYDVRSPEGQRMVRLYANAVRTMQSTAESDPRSWVFQWYTHFTKGSTRKSAEIARLYPEPSPWRDLAIEMWNTCQAHSRGQDENFFLPWHRMFVYYFESIVRAASGDDSFTLPYWNYSTCDPALRGVLPDPFREPQDASNPLYVEKRNPGVNDGRPIQEGEPGDPLNLDALAECTYEEIDDTIQGFCLALDAGLHGQIHVLVGGTQNMGAVPWAAGDPIFWMHHCNIDRLWASWNAAGRQNLADPDFLAQTFVFADVDGQRVVATIRDFLDIAPLGYSYDHLEPVPACPPESESIEPAVVHARAAAPISLAARRTDVELEPPPGAESEPLAARVEDMAGGRRLFLVLRDLQTDVQPGVLYHVYLEAPAAEGQPPEAHLVGSINFFDAEDHEDHGGADAEGATPADAARPEKFHSFDVTELVRRLAAADRLSGTPRVTIAPADAPAAEAEPLVGEVRLVER